MPLNTPVASYSLKALQPVGSAEYPFLFVQNFQPNLSLAAGTVLGISTTQQNDVQTVTVAGSPTGGSYVVNYYSPVGPGAAQPITVHITDSLATIQAALNAAFGNNNVVATGSPTALVLTGSNAFANQPIAPATLSSVSLTGGTSPSASIAHTTTGSTGNAWAAYASGNTDGTQIPRGLLRWQITTDGSGLVSFGDQVAGDEWGGKEKGAPVFVQGFFDTQDLVGLDANALTASGWRIVSGTLASGVIKL